LSRPVTATGARLFVVVPSPSCPYPLNPQHCAAPSRSSAQACWYPRVTPIAPLSVPMAEHDTLRLLVRWHAPTPTTHATALSSVAPLQLSSAPLQRSVVGLISPGHAVPHDPATQVCVPARQTPTPVVPIGPV
jgi:hypothetical protein